ncbi:hypothetical protein WJ66_03168 [Stenotrophomonas maltophilia WJ66]|nr:hypothetical protein WJ66_03168 [Stenotrophomonas maltophilia WJ66]
MALQWGLVRRWGLQVAEQMTVSLLVRVQRSEAEPMVRWHLEETHRQMKLELYPSATAVCSVAS